jgi:hypothetical protein
MTITVHNDMADNGYAPVDIMNEILGLIKTSTEQACIGMGLSRRTQLPKMGRYSLPV